MNQPDRSSTTSGDRGHAWITAQTVDFCCLAAAPPVLRSPIRTSTRILGAALAGTARGWMAFAYRSLGNAHSAWLTPVAGATLATTGAYRLVPHPVYLGWTGLSLGWSLLSGSPLALMLALATGVFYDRRARVEERAVEAVHPLYAGYRARARRLVPWVY
jgi:protein-S-isoprenylcysteine O-methyltransferase Ste14